MSSGYFRYPSIHKNKVVFVCEDDLWEVGATGGLARRLTANKGEASWPVLSPDGTHLAFTGQEEGSPEIYLMPANGGPSKRMTYIGNYSCHPVGWADDNHIVFAHSGSQPFGQLLFLYTLDVNGNVPEQINVGPARALSFGPNGEMVIGRNNNDPAHWKRYRGGTAGQIWIDSSGDRQFRPLIDLEGNLDSPMWLGRRIYFLSDHEGIANLYSCTLEGNDLKRHTNHDTYYARNAKSDGRRIVYHAGADLYIFDPAADSDHKINIDFQSSKTQRSRKFVSASRYLEHYDLHPKGHSIAITSRGKPFSFGNWEGPVLQYGEEEARYRLLNWLNDGKRLIAVTDAKGEENFVLLQQNENGLLQSEIIEDLDIGRPVELKVNPQKEQIIFSNHRHELFQLDLSNKSLALIDKGKSNRIMEFNWSPDGEWVVYSVPISLQISILKLWQAQTGETHQITSPLLQDVDPSFDPQGKYIYFLSYRDFDPVYDNMHFDLSFPQGMRPYLITLQKDMTSPFMSRSNVLLKHSNGDKSNDNRSAKNNGNEDRNGENNDKPNDSLIKIDLEGITDRMIAFPVREALYGRIRGTEDGKVIYSRYPVEGTLNQSWFPSTPPAKGSIYIYDFENQEEERLLSGISNYRITSDGANIVYRSGNALRALKARSKPEENSKNASRKSGWLNLTRVKVSVIPAQEWSQMYSEIWRLQRDQFWTRDMAQVDWLAVYKRYEPLLERIASRSEFSDLISEMQGELGTSHTLEIGGDYRPGPNYRQGFLGVDLDYNSESDRWRITHIVNGDAWDEKTGSPLNRPGHNVSENDYLLAINGRRLNKNLTPGMALVDLAGQEVSLTMATHSSANGDSLNSYRSITAKTLPDESASRYREWVENNRSMVHEETDGRAGYIHIPDMGPRGYAEFHRGFLAEMEREGMIIDVRFNGGGFVSQLILEKLIRKRIAYVVSRWSETPSPYPRESIMGPIVTLTNEYAGSDGDIFSHSFKQLGLGPLIGTRTWGGVIGINPRHPLVDGTVTTQPEYSLWFADVGWQVENYGTDPDIEIDNTPQDYIAGVDAQLQRSISEIIKLLEENPPQMPTFERPPSKALPVLPALKEKE